MNASSYFLTGTDTEIGKTFSACALLHAWRERGLVAAAYKPVAAGAEQLDGAWSNDDARRLQAAATPGFTLAQINPVCLRTPIAPHLAARIEGRSLELAELVAGHAYLRERSERLIVEGVGGFRVPLGDDFDSADLACALGLPVILVVGLRLGCINHAALTAEAILARGLRLHGWIGNRPGATMQCEAENIATLNGLLPAPCLGILPHQADGGARGAASALQLDTL